MFQKILLCSDGSDRSIAAAEAAVELAKAHKAQLTLLHVCQVPSVNAPFPGAPSISNTALGGYVTDMHNAVLKRTVPALEHAGVRYDILEDVGHPAEVISRVANQQAYDLIVLGSRGIGMDSAAKVGSVCHSVIQNAFCPVLVVR